MPVHTISSDLHRGNVERHAVSLARTMTKLRALGMPLVDTVRAVTVNPARAAGLEERGFGRLRAGDPARVTVFDEVAEDTEIEDATGEVRTATRRIETRGVAVGSRYFERTQPL